MSDPKEAPRRTARSRSSTDLPFAEVEAPAKVNLFLRVLSRDDDGFHRVRTLLQSLEWGDRIVVEQVSGNEIELDVHGFNVGPVAENLVVRAAKGFLATAGLTTGLRIHLQKRIPPGSGLGGGSSDAASTLLALSVLLDRPLSQSALWELAASLGSDVPFFLAASPLALVEGRGERVLALPPLPGAHVLVGLTPMHVSTGEAYQALDRARERWDPNRQPELVSILDELDWDKVERLAHNDFQEVVFARYPKINEAWNALSGTDPLFLMLSGSGGAVFAVYKGEEEATRALQELEERAGSTPWLLTRTRVVTPRVGLIRPSASE